MRVVKAPAVQLSPVLYSREVRLWSSPGIWTRRSRACSKRPRGDRPPRARAHGVQLVPFGMGDVSSETYQQLTGKPAQTVRDFLFGHKAALTAAA
jgi:hypothetical protein